MKFRRTHIIAELLIEILLLNIKLSRDQIDRSLTCGSLHTQDLVSCGVFSILIPDHMSSSMQVDGQASKPSDCLQ